MSSREVRLERRTYRPGERLIGRIEPSEGAQAEEFTVELGWETRGYGETETCIVETLDIQTVPEETAEFIFDLPEGPYSCRGKHVSIHWFVQIRGGKEAHRAEFSLSPAREPLDLHHLQPKAKGKR